MMAPKAKSRLAATNGKSEPDETPAPTIAEIKLSKKTQGTERINAILKELSLDIVAKPSVDGTGKVTWQAVIESTE